MRIFRRMRGLKYVDVMRCQFANRMGVRMCEFFDFQMRNGIKNASNQSTMNRESQRCSEIALQAIDEVV